LTRQAWWWRGWRDGSSGVSTVEFDRRELRRLLLSRHNTHDMTVGDSDRRSRAASAHRRSS
jgi:hypothetical protein